MSRPRPKFAIGEEAIVLGSISGKSYGVQEVVDRKWEEELEFLHIGLYTGWVYKTSGWCEGNKSMTEDNLRKIPPEERTNLIADIWQPKDVEVPA